jgi:hypothetical protein
LDAHDRPASPTIAAGAFSVSWLQDALDLFHSQFPLAATILAAQVTIPTTGVFTAPADFIIDMRNGLVLAQSNIVSAARLLRVSYQKLLTRQTYGQQPGIPRNYSVLGKTIRVWPTPDVAYAATMNYYAMPAVLASGDIPNFPSDQILIDLVKLRALEWARIEKNGSALMYARSEITNLRAAGLFNESENTEIPLDEEQFARTGAGSTPWSWMGPWSAS